MKQIVAHKKLSTLHGLLLVAGLMLVLILLNYVVLGFLATYLGNAASSLAFWVLGALIAWVMLRVYVVKLCYELDDEALHITRSYGKRERYVENIYLSQLMFVGEPVEAQKRFPNARRVKATHAKGEHPVCAVAYRASDGHRIALLQLNDELKSALKAKIKEK